MISDVKLKNWRSHWDSEFSFSKGTNALIGVMGAGKSSLLDSISFALFGTFPALQARKLTLDNVIMNRPQVREKAEVEVSFEAGEKYTVKRVVERGKGTTKAEIRKGGILLDTGSSRVTELVEKALKINYDLFSRAIYSEQNGLDSFLTIPRGQRMRKIDALLRIDKFESARSSATTLANRIRDNVRDKTKLIGEMEDKEDFGKIGELEKEIRGLEKEQEKLEEERSKAGKEKEKLEKDYEKEKEKASLFKEKEKELDVLTGAVKNLSEDLETFRNLETGKEIAKKIKKAEDELEKEEKALEENRKKIREALEKESGCRVSIKELVERIESLKPAEGKCPVCEKKLTKSHKEKIIKKSKEEIRKKEGEMKKTRKELEELEEKNRTLKKKIDRAKEELYELGSMEKKIKEQEEKKKKLVEYKKKLHGLEKELEEKKKAAGKEKAEKLQKRLQELYGRCSELGANLENNRRLLKEREEQLKGVEEKKKLFESYRKQVKKMQALSEELKKFEKALKETQVTLRREFVDAVNFTMDRIWEYLYPYEDLTNLRLSVNEGDYSLELKESRGSWVTVEGIASGGERTTACLALRIAFALVLAPNLKWLVLDEPTHNLDSQAVEYLAEVLRTRVGEFVDQVFLITHDEKLESAVTGYLYRLERKREKNEPTHVRLVGSPYN